ncbi:MAG: hypothetical protein MZU97_00655 [Bacillus subtilis]|nr:hypothetical protein [Bacillus subtilis]
MGYKGHTGLGLTITKTIFDRHQIQDRRSIAVPKAARGSGSSFRACCVNIGQINVKIAKSL